MKRLILVGSMLLTPIFAHSEPGHDILDHGIVAETMWCHVNYATVAQAEYGNNGTSDLFWKFFNRAQFFADYGVTLTVELGHDFKEYAQEAANLAELMPKLQFDDWKAYTEYLDCDGRYRAANP